MWYLLPCPPKKEEMILKACKNQVDGTILSDAFIFTCDRMRRYLGAWHQEKTPLFPGYVFLEGEEAECIDRVKECCPQVFSLGEGAVIRGRFPKERELLARLSDADHHIAMSKGVIRGGETFVTEGPLSGKEELIARIDRHKRAAFLNVPMFENVCGVQVGLEITEKQE